MYIVKSGRAALNKSNKNNKGNKVAVTFTQIKAYDIQKINIILDRAVNSLVKKRFLSY